MYYIHNHDYARWAANIFWPDILKSGKKIIEWLYKKKSYLLILHNNYVNSIWGFGNPVQQMVNLIVMPNSVARAIA